LFDMKEDEDINYDELKGQNYVPIRDRGLSKGINLKEGYMTEPESHAKVLPSSAKRLFGCLHCEWRNSSLCPFGFRTGKGHHTKDNCHRNGICKDRTNWLLSFSRGYKKRPTYTEWKDDFNDAMAQVVMNEDYHNLKVKESELKDLDKQYEEMSKEDRKKVHRLERQRDKARRDWQYLWSELRKYAGHKIDRETPKKLDVDVKHLSIDDIQRYMRDEKVVEAEVVKE
jgi:hypothetical protein